MEITTQPTDTVLPPQGPRTKEFTLNRKQFGALVSFCSETGSLRLSAPDRSQGNLIADRNASSLMRSVTRLDPKDPANKGVITSHCAAAFGAASTPDLQGHMLTFLASANYFTPDDIELLGQYRRALDHASSNPGAYSWDHNNLTSGILARLQEAERKSEPNDGLMLAVLSIAASSAPNPDAGSYLIGKIQTDFAAQ